MLNSGNRFFKRLSFFIRSLYSRSCKSGRASLRLGCAFHVLPGKHDQAWPRAEPRAMTACTSPMKICCIFAIEMLYPDQDGGCEAGKGRMGLGFRHSSTPLGTGPRLGPRCRLVSPAMIFTGAHNFARAPYFLDIKIRDHGS